MRRRGRALVATFWSCCFSCCCGGRTICIRTPCHAATDASACCACLAAYLALGEPMVCCARCALPRAPQVRKTGQVVRAMCIMSHPIPNTNDSHSVQVRGRA